MSPCTDEDVLFDGLTIFWETAGSLLLLFASFEGCRIEASFEGVFGKDVCAVDLFVRCEDALEK